MEKGFGGGVGGSGSGIGLIFSGVEAPGFRDSVFGLKWALGFKVPGFGFQGLGIPGFGIRVYVVGFRVSGFGFGSRL